MKSQKTCVLIVDDDPDACFLLERTFKRTLPPGSAVYCASSGDDAIAYFTGSGRYSDRLLYPFPSLLITDLRMRNGDGFLVLEFLHHNPGWSIVPKIVFSCSDDDDDVTTAFLLGAHAYHQKPMCSKELETLVHTLTSYWSNCLVPPVDASGRIQHGDISGKIGDRYLPPPGTNEQMIHPREPQTAGEKVVSGSGSGQSHRD